MTDDQSTESRMKLRAYRDLAQGRINRMAFRGALYLALAGIGASVVPVLWWGPMVALAIGSALAERAAALTFLTATDGAADAMVDGLERPFALALLASGFCFAISVVIVRIFSGPEIQIFPLCFIAIATLANILFNQQVHALMIARQALYGATAVAMTGYEATLAGGIFSVVGLQWILPVVGFAVCAMLISQRSSDLYRERLAFEGQLTAARDAAEAAVASRDAFISTVSHELRTPLNGILGMAQLLLSDKTDAGQRRQIETIIESGRTLNTLLTDLLDHSKLEAGKLTIDPAVADLRSAVDHIAGLFGTLAAEKGLELQVVIGPEIPERLVFDPVRVRQCLSNLISNALKFTESGSVRVAVTGEARGLGPDGAPRYLITVLVTDTGTGIPAGGQAQLFQPFSQADASIARRFGGTGLGLSITRQLAESMGGAVTLESTSDEGSVFRLTFAADGAGDTGHVQASDESPPVLIERRVLVVDDVESNRMVLRLFLRTLGVEVVEAADGLAALEALTQSRFDAAFLDLNMRGMGGVEIASSVRLGKAGRRDLPLLAVSADSALRGVDIGADGFDAAIVKPVDLSQLQHTLADAIQRRTQGASAQPLRAR